MRFCRENKLYNFVKVAAVEYSKIPNGPRRYGATAMVLDTIIGGKFIFKNTYAENKQVEIPVEKGPLEFYYVHIEVSAQGIAELLKRKHEAELFKRKLEAELLKRKLEAELEEKRRAAAPLQTSSENFSEELFDNIQITDTETYVRDGHMMFDHHMIVRDTESYPSLRNIHDEQQGTFSFDQQQGTVSFDEQQGTISLDEQQGYEQQGNEQQVND